MMDIIYPYSSGSFILYNKYRIRCQPINPPNYVIKTLQKNINYSIKSTNFDIILVSELMSNLTSQNRLVRRGLQSTYILQLDLILS